jgi:MFS transporter, DHA1 family, multidrug resistance protein
MTIASGRSPRLSKATAWFARWGPILPLLAAEFILWLGFGALLPIMAPYFNEHGVRLEMLGFVIAAWPAARLVAEPAFGWLADRTERVPLMVIGLVVAGIALGLPLVFTGPIEFLVLRAVAGLATALYDPAARGFLTDSTPPERRGEAFGLYGSAQMGGLLLGPAIGGIGAELFGGLAFVFVFGALTTLLAALAVGLRVRESAQVLRHRPGTATPEGGDGAATDAPDALPSGHRPPTTLLNRWILAALVLNIGGYFAGGTYEVIWSLFLLDRGASMGLVGLTFATFALPVLIVSPFAGRMVDRRGSYPFIVAGSLMTATASVIYPFVPDPIWVIPILLVEATGIAILSPALYAVVAAGSPRGRTSTAQGLFGASGTLGTIVASIATGYIAEVNLNYPFWVGAAVMYVCLAIGLAVGGGMIRRLTPAGHASAAAAKPT